MRRKGLPLRRTDLSSTGVDGLCHICRSPPDTGNTTGGPYALGPHWPSHGLNRSQRSATPSDARGKQCVPSGHRGSWRGSLQHCRLGHMGRSAQRKHASSGKDCSWQAAVVWPHVMALCPNRSPRWKRPVVLGVQLSRCCGVRPFSLKLGKGTVQLMGKSPVMGVE